MYLNGLLPGFAEQICAACAPSNDRFKLPADEMADEAAGLLFVVLGSGFRVWGFGVQGVGCGK